MDPLDDQNLDARLKVKFLTIESASTKTEFSSEAFIEEIELVATDDYDCQYPDNFCNTSSF